MLLNIQRTICIGIISLVICTLLLPGHAAAANPFSPANLPGGPYYIDFPVGEAYYTVDNQVISMDATAYFDANRTFVPVRYLALALGIPESNLVWNPEQASVSFDRDGVYIQMIIGQPVIIINGSINAIDVSPQIRDSRIYLPARFIAEAFGYVTYLDAEDPPLVLIHRPIYEMYLEDTLIYSMQEFDPGGYVKFVNNGTIARSIALSDGTPLCTLNPGQIAAFQVNQSGNYQLLLDGKTGILEVNVH